MKRPSLVSAGSLNRLLQAAEAAWQQKDFSQCLDALQSAHRLAPSNTGILLQLGRIHGLRYDYAAAERCFESALRIAPKKMEMLAAIADSCQNFRNPAVAEQFLRRAVALPDATPQICVKLAELCERLRRLPEATELVDRALALNPAFPAALLVRARLERLAGRYEAAVAVLRSFLTKPIADVWVHTQAWYELATILDRQEHYDDAMTAFLNAKSLLRPQAPKYLAELKVMRDRLKVMEANVSAEMLQRWLANAPAMPPPRRLALLCGHARSGTTLLEQVLDAHPDIVTAEETKIFHLDVCLPLAKARPPEPDAADTATFQLKLEAVEAAPLELLQRLRENYFRSMERCLGEPLAGRMLVDKNPALWMLISGFPRVFPEAKFLVALRDPRDVCLSCFTLNLPPRFEIQRTAYFNLSDIVDKYVEEMTLWRTLAPLMQGRYLEVRYEDMVEDLESVARKTLDFLGLPWDPGVLRFHEQAQQKVMSHGNYKDVSQPVYQRARQRWRNYGKYFEPYQNKLEPFVKAFGYD